LIAWALVAHGSSGPRIARPAAGRIRYGARVVPGLRGASEQKMQFSKPLQNSQILQWLACHRFGWTFLAAKISRKNPNFCDKFCNRKKP
jgi:hypothetical protein